MEDHPPAETLVSPGAVSEEEIGQPAVAAGVLVAEVFTFGDIVERILEVLLVVLVGVSLASHFDIRGLLLGAILLLVIRPAAVALSLIGRGTTRVQMKLIAWFGIRGVGSVYYLAYAVTHGLPSAQARPVASMILTAVALSVLAHGLTSQLLMQWYGARRRD